MALLVPEYILAWAIRQWLVANAIARAGREKGWTRAHGFFLIMGGFHVFESTKRRETVAEEEKFQDNKIWNAINENWPESLPQCNDPGKPSYPLDERKAVRLLKERKIQLPTEEEIKDRSKTDWLAKTIVLLQTIWFIAQCIARAIQHLPVTDLEIVTLAYTTMSFWIYLAWWDKPRNLDRPIRVYLDQDAEEGDGQSQAPAGTEGGLSLSDRLWTTVDFMIGDQDDTVDLKKLKEVPIFYSGDPTFNQILLSDVITMMFGIVFGAVHCIAWHFHFPSDTERVLWRLSSVTITTVPLLITLSSFAWPILFSNERSNWTKDKHFLIKIAVNTLVIVGATIFIASLVLGGVLYVLARITTLILAFIELRSLPDGAYRAVYWTTLIPHL